MLLQRRGRGPSAGAVVGNRGVAARGGGVFRTIATTQRRVRGGVRQQGGWLRLAPSQWPGWPGQLRAQPERPDDICTLLRAWPGLRAPSGTLVRLGEAFSLVAIGAGRWYLASTACAVRNEGLLGEGGMSSQRKPLSPHQPSAVAREPAAESHQRPRCFSQ